MCHTLRDPKPGRDEPLELRLTENLKYGTRCNLKDHYFHRMGCSKLHGEGVLCGACHQYERKLADGGTLPVYTTYADWASGPYAEAGMECQDCHMPGASAEIAQGAGERNNVASHDFLGASDELRRKAAGLAVQVEAKEETLVVSVTVENVGAGHPIPAGSPLRRLVLTVSVTNESGTRVTESTRFGRSLVDSAGTPAPFFRATRVADDNRIPPQRSAKSTFSLPAPESAGKVEVVLGWRPVDHELAKQLGREPEADQEIRRVELPISAPNARGVRRGLPHSVRNYP